MATKLISAMRKAVQRFQTEVVAPAMTGEQPDLHMLGVFIDRGPDGYRVVVLVHASSDLGAAEPVAQQYFGAFPYKVKVDDARPEATLDAGSPVPDISDFEVPL